MTENDLEHSAAPDHVHRPGKIRQFAARTWTYFLGWFGLSGLIASSTTCPYCGQVGCPVGVGQAAGLGFFSMAVIWLFTKKGWRKKSALPKPPSPGAD